jgi:DNA-binding SARP family transcriptional activator/TolB-like protein
MGDEVVEGAQDDLVLNSGIVWSDVAAFQDAVTTGSTDVADMYRGPFLDGFHLKHSPEFESWAESVRDRLARQFGRTLESLAETTAAAGDKLAAAEWWGRLAAHDPFSSRIAGRYMVALANVGERARAIQFAGTHTSRLRAELEVEPDAEFRAIVVRLQQPAEQALGATTLTPAGQSRIAPPAPDAPQAPAEVISPPPVAADVLPRKVSRWRGVAAVVATMCVVIAVAVYALRPIEKRASPPEGSAVLVVPFEISSGTSDVGYLREGLVDLVSAGLSTARAVRTIDARTALATFSSSNVATVDDALSAARTLGAEFVVHGAVVVSQDRLHLTAVVRDTGGHDVVPLAFDAPPDSLPILVDALVSHVLATVTSEPARNRPHLARYPTEAVRAFVMGQSAYRKGRWTDAISSYRLALQHDSTFGLAALGLLSSALWTGDNDDRDLGQSLAWQARKDLAPAEQAYIEALVGPTYPIRPTMQVRLAAWERAASLAGDRADVWFALGDEYFHNGALLGIDEPMARASKAFERALAIVPGYSAPLVHLIQIRALENDTAGIRSLLDRHALDAIEGEQFFAQWRVREALADKRRARSDLPGIDRADEESLRAIVLTSLYEGIGQDGASAALDEMFARAVTTRETRGALLGRHAFDMVRGRFEMAARSLDALAALDATSSEAYRYDVADAMYDGGDRTRAERAAQALRRLLSTEKSLTPKEDRCSLEQWNLEQNDTASAREAIRGLQARHPAVSEDVQQEADVCAQLLNAILAVRGNAPGKVQALAALDSALATGPNLRFVASYAPLAVARLHASDGDTTRALRAVRRRGWFGRWPHYRAAHLELEVRLAAATGDERGREAAARTLRLLRGNKN